MMKTTLKEFENKRPLIVFEWKDAFSEAEGWLVINSLRGGAAGGECVLVLIAERWNPSPKPWR
jgi:hypothetical protein